MTVTARRSPRPLCLGGSERMKRLADSLRAFIDSCTASVGSMDIRDLVALLTLAALFFISHTTTAVVFVALVSVTSLLVTRVRRGPWIWLVTALFFAPGLLLNWHHQEDHTYLAVYWCLVLALAFGGRRPLAVLRSNGRVLIGLVFAFAVMWKIITPAFVDGSLFHYKLLFDYRFRDAVTQPIGRLSDVETQRNLESLGKLQAPTSCSSQAVMQYPETVSWLAHGLTWATIVMELALALTFLLRYRWFHRFRNSVLCLFMLSTYTLVPVLGFGMLFASLGIAQTRRREKGARLAYLATALLISVWFYR